RSDLHHVRSGRWGAVTLACTAMQKTFDAILEARLSRRTLVGTAATVGLAACARVPTSSTPPSRERPFRSIAPGRTDEFRVADGDRYDIIARWGDSLVAGTPDFDTRRMKDTSWLDATAADAQ